MLRRREGAVRVKVVPSCVTLCHPMSCAVHGIPQARMLGWEPFPLSRGSSQPRDRIQVSCMQMDSLPSEPPGKPKNTGVGSLSFLQGIFLTQESNWGLPHCRRILYQLIQKRSPRIQEWVAYPFSSRYCQPRNRTGVSCTAGRLFTN